MKRSPRRAPAENGATSPLEFVLRMVEELAGAIVLLDHTLRIVEVTPSADILLGHPPRGVLASKVFCGASTARPIAEALAAGRRVDGEIPSPTGVGRVRIRAEPMLRAAKLVGFMLFVDDAREASSVPSELGGIRTREPAVEALFQLIRKVAKSDATVLVRGETGAGKELVARALHDLSRRHKGPFRAINCAAMPAALLESELFGHVRGAFTGAVRDNPGQFRLASGGTLLLDEVAELPLELQAKLLRALETRSVLPVGGSDPIQVDVRVVAATNRPLRREVEAGRFRADLMYRLRVIPLFLPALRARRGDVPLLTEQLLQELNQKSERQVLRVARAAQEALQQYDWPGNVRELRNVLEYAFVVGDGPILERGHLPPEVAAPHRTVDGEPLAVIDAVGATAASPEARRVARALERANGNKARAAKALGMSRVTLWRRMKELDYASTRPNGAGGGPSA